MAETQKLKAFTVKSNKQAVIEQLWLTYYNDILYKKGIITEDQRNRMRIMIKNRTMAKIK